ncbi:MAG: mechanosensitive ion channel [Spartobacteria bacterium]|nr:mechanosensitive ion channel [Spartobacteria bacterium]
MRVLCIFFLLLGLLGAGGTWAEGSNITERAIDDVESNAVPAVIVKEAPLAPAETLFSIEELQLLRKDTEVLAATDENAKKTLERIDRTISLRREAQRMAAMTEALRAYVASAPELMAKEQAEMQLLNSTEAVLPDSAATNDVPALRLALKENAERIAAAEQALKTASDALSSPLQNSAKIKEMITESRKKLDGLEAEMNATVEQGAFQNPSQRQSFLAGRLLYASEIDYYDLLSREYDVLNRLQTLQRDVAVAKVARYRKKRVLWSALLDDRLSAEVKQSRAAAEQQKRDVAGGPVILRELAERNLALNDELKKYYTLDAEAAARLEQAEQSLKNQQSDAESMKQRFDIVGPTESIGLLLMRRRAELPARPKYRIAFTRRQSLISEAANRQLDVDAERSKLANLKSAVSAVMQSLPTDATGIDEVREQVTNLLETRKQNLTELYTVLGSYISKQSVIQMTENKLIAQSEAFRNQLDEWLMITPTMPHLTFRIFFTAFPLAAKNLIENIQRDKHRLRNDIMMVAHDSPYPTLLAALGTLIAFMLRPAMRKRMDYIVLRIGKIRTDSFAYTLETLFYTCVFALPIPLLIRTFALSLKSTVTDTSILIQGCAQGLLSASALLAMISLLRQTVCPNGLAELHFGWARATLAAFSRELYLFSFGAVPLVFIIAFNVQSTLGMDEEGDGRVAFTLLMLLTTAFSYRLLRKRSVIRQEFQRHCIATNEKHWAMLWLPIAACVPAVLAIIAGMGYGYASVQLTQRAFLSVLFMFSLLIVRDMLIRWLMLVERRLRYRDAVRRLEESRAERSRSEEKSDNRQDLSVDIPPIDFGHLGDKAKRLIRTGMIFGAIIGIWSIWINALPLFNYLDEARLPVSLTSFISGGEQSVLTLGDIASLVITIVLTIIAVSNLPGLIELLLLQSVHFDAGARYAITKLTQYAIVMTGIIFSAGALGFRWENIQWLVAALSVGIGFGLQEVVANFICGILILFERPVRVGDIITIGDTTGIVSRVRMRATTVVNWERQEQLIPNKEFITGRVLNWTLSDTVNRVVINVGIAYGSDVSRALAILSSICEANKNILRDPKWMVHFDGFGDSSLNLILRAYIPSMDNRLETITQLNTAIHEQFNANGIVIPFPQRDVHMI